MELQPEVAGARAALGPLPEPVARPVLIVVSGLPGTGKSYFSRKLSQRLPTIVVESDTLRKALYPRPSYSGPESQGLFQVLHQLLQELLTQGISVILDATNLVEHHRERLYSIADRLRIKLILVRVEAPAEVVRQRLEGRRRGADPADSSDAGWGVYQKMKGQAQAIRRNHFAVDTSRDISPVLDKIAREARR